MNLQQIYLNVAAKLPISPDVKARLDRAYDIVRQLGSGYDIKHVSNGVYRVEKASTSMFSTEPTIYTTDSKSCSCPDFEKARAGLCKHRLAVLMIQEMEN